MKKTIRIAIAILSFSLPGWSAGKFQAELSGCYLAPNDQAFKEVYGQGGFVPEIRLQYDIGPAFYVWGGAGMFAKKGLTPQLQKEAKSRQTYLSLGGGYDVKLTEALHLRLGPGLFLASYKEEIGEEEQSGSSLGWRLDADLLYSLGERLLAGITAGYASASDTVENVSFKMGGFKVGATIGIRF
jgi:hypothetical protein